MAAVVNGGVAVEVAQELAWPLTTGRYAHVRLHDLTRTLAAPPAAVAARPVLGHRHRPTILALKCRTSDVSWVRSLSLWVAVCIGVVDQSDLAHCLWRAMGIAREDGRPVGRDKKPLAVLRARAIVTQQVDAHPAG
jgi:hypothetical protein